MVPVFNITYSEYPITSEGIFDGILYKGLKATMWAIHLQRRYIQRC